MKNRLLDLLSTPPPPRDGGDRATPAFDPERLQTAAETWIRKNPAVALGAALAVGVFLGWLIKRK